MTLLESTNTILSVATLLAQLGIIAFGLYFIFFRKTQNALVMLVQKNGILLAFLIALVSMLGSLFYSNVIGFAPCELCWFQRIFMYPLVFLLGMALWKKDRHIVDYALTLSVVGGLISLYHNYMYYYNQGLDALCQLGGTQVSCMMRYVFELGYITIPLMALTGFALVITFLLMKKYEKPA